MTSGPHQLVLQRGHVIGIVEDDERFDTGILIEPALDLFSSGHRLGHSPRKIGRGLADDLSNHSDALQELNQFAELRPTLGVVIEVPPRRANDNLRTSRADDGVQIGDADFIEEQVNVSMDDVDPTLHFWILVRVFTLGLGVLFVVPAGIQNPVDV